MTTAIATDAAELDGLDAAANAFLALASKEDADPKKEQPSEETTSNKKPEVKLAPQKEVEEEAPEAEATEEAPDESPEADTEEPEEETPEKKYADGDDVYVKVTVNGKEQEFSVNALKRLAGQEQALTQKSQETAAVRQKAEAELQRYAAGLDVMVKLAEARANEFRQVNWMALTKDPNVNAEQLAILQTEARKAFEQESFLKQELGQFVNAQTETTKAHLAQQAQACVTALTDNAGPHYIEGWNDKLYGDLRSFAVAEGLDQNTVNALVDPAAIKLLHMAMSFKKGSAKVVATKKVDKTPKKIVKTSQTPAAQGLKPSREKEAMKKLKATGSQDDAADAFLARLQSHNDE